MCPVQVQLVIKNQIVYLHQISDTDWEKGNEGKSVGTLFSYPLPKQETLRYLILNLVIFGS